MKKSRASNSERKYAFQFLLYFRCQNITVDLVPLFNFSWKGWPMMKIKILRTCCFIYEVTLAFILVTYKNFTQDNNFFSEVYKAPKRSLSAHNACILQTIAAIPSTMKKIRFTIAISNTFLLHIRDFKIQERGRRQRRPEVKINLCSSVRMTKSPDCRVFARHESDKCSFRVVDKT